MTCSKKKAVPRQKCAIRTVRKAPGPSPERVQGVAGGSTERRSRGAADLNGAPGAFATTHIAGEPPPPEAAALAPGTRCFCAVGRAPGHARRPRGVRGSRAQPGGRSRQTDSHRSTGASALKAEVTPKASNGTAPTGSRSGVVFVVVSLFLASEPPSPLSSRVYH